MSASRVAAIRPGPAFVYPHASQMLPRKRAQSCALASSSSRAWLRCSSCCWPARRSARRPRRPPAPLPRRRRSTGPVPLRPSTHWVPAVRDDAERLQRPEAPARLASAARRPCRLLVAGRRQRCRLHRLLGRAPLGLSRVRVRAADLHDTAVDVHQPWANHRLADGRKRPRLRRLADLAPQRRGQGRRLPR